MIHILAQVLKLGCSVYFLGRPVTSHLTNVVAIIRGVSIGRRKGRSQNKSFDDCFPVTADHVSPFSFLN